MAARACTNFSNFLARRPSRTVASECGELVDLRSGSGEEGVERGGVVGSKEEPLFSQQDCSEVREKVDSKEEEKLGWLLQENAAPEGGAGSEPTRGQDTVRSPL